LKFRSSQWYDGGTLLFDLLSAGEDAVYANRFDISLLAGRLKAATLWLLRRP
jgi:putative phosphoribosyl transferase